MIMSLPYIPVMDHLHNEVRKTRAYVSSAEVVSGQIDTLERLIESCVNHSGIKSPLANNLTVSLIAQLRFSTSAMFLGSDETMPGNVISDGECQVPALLTEKQ